MSSRDFGIGLFGFGTIGAGLVRALQNNGSIIRKNIGFDIKLLKIVDVDTTRDRGVTLEPEVLSNSKDDILNNKDIKCVVELIGGTGIAKQIVEDALISGRHVVTANKDLISKHGAELSALAARSGVCLLYEASVGGGIPILTPLSTCLKGNRMKRVIGIVNGTTNYILTQMKENKTDFDDCLKAAQSLGYAEANPTNDIEGLDAAYKATILCSIAFGKHVKAENVHREGITKVSLADMEHADALGYAVKLLAYAQERDGAMDVRVHPTLLAKDHPLATIGGVTNGVYVEGEPIGPLLFVGRGAGPDATSSAVLGDIIEIAECRAMAPRYSRELHEPADVFPIGDIECPFYMRIVVADRPGVLADVARIFSVHNVSISSNFQKPLDRKTAEIVWTTHTCREADMRAAIEEIRALPAVSDIPSVLRILEENPAPAANGNEDEA